MFSFSFMLKTQRKSESCSVESDSLRQFYTVLYILHSSIHSTDILYRLLYSPWNSPGQNTGVGIHSLLQGIFPTQGRSEETEAQRYLLTFPKSQSLRAKARSDSRHCYLASLNVPGHKKDLTEDGCQGSKQRGHF